MVRFGDLKIGDRFTYMGLYFVKTTDRRTLCYDMETYKFISDIYEFAGGDRVTPVNV